MSEGSNHNLAAEFRKHPDRAKWLVDKVLPAMEKHFEDFDVNFVVGTLTDDSMDVKKIKSLYHSFQKKQNSFHPKDLKRARPAYQFFCNEKRKELQEENDDVGFGEINKMLGQMWGDLSDKERKPYEKQAEKDKQRYTKEYDSAKQKAIARGEFKENPLKALKKPRTSYLCFSTDPSIRKKYSKKAAGDIKELMRILGHQWKKMNEEEKQPYVDMADEDKARYEKEKEVALKKHKKLQESLQQQPQPQQENDDDDEDEDEAVQKQQKKKTTSKAKNTKAKSNKKPSNKKKVKKPSVSSDEDEDDE